MKNSLRKLCNDVMCSSIHGLVSVLVYTYVYTYIHVYALRPAAS